MAHRRGEDRGYRGQMGAHADESRRDSGRELERGLDRDREILHASDPDRDYGSAYDAEEDMGGTGWSGASGRGGIRGHRGHREHRGFSNYAGGGDRDMRRGWPARGGQTASMRDRPMGGPAPRGTYPMRGYGGEDDERRFGGETTGRGYGGYRPDMAGGENWGSMRGREIGGGPARPGSFSPNDMGFGWRDEEARGPHYGKGPKGYKRSDERIHEDVCDAIAQQGFIDASDVEVKVEGGVVVLGGTVARRDEKRGLEELAERVYGVDEVRNEIRLRRAEAQRPQGSQARGPSQPQPQARGASQPSSPARGALSNGPSGPGAPNGDRSARS
jgi:hypothetical protein